MRKICTAVTLVAAVLAGGSSMASAAAAPAALPMYVGPGDCGPLHDGDGSAPPATSQSQDTSNQPRKEHSPYAGNYCADDAGAPVAPEPRRPGAPATTQSQGAPTQSQGAAQNGPAANPQPNPQASSDKPNDGTGAGRTGPLS